VLWGVAFDTRWWPPFCLVVDWVAAAILVVPIAIGAREEAAPILG
jgi:hypothetical protein